MEQILELAAQLGFSHGAQLNIAALEFRQEVRDMCAADRCLSLKLNRLLRI